MKGSRVPETVYISKLPSDFGPGYYVEAKGHIKQPCDVFALNFLVEKTVTTDILFHLALRLSSKSLVRNNFVNYSWINEEYYVITPYNQLSLVENTDFHIAIFLTDFAYMVEVNGKYICQFQYRTSPEKAKLIELKGDCEVHDVSFKNISKFPLYGRKFVTNKEVHIFDRTKTVNKVPEDFGPGYYIEIKGFVLEHCNEFSFDFVLVNDTADISFHLKVDLQNHTLVRNERIKSVWGTANTNSSECFEKYKILPNTEFCIGIAVKKNEYLVQINGKHVGEFLFRLHPLQVKFFNFQGGCEIYDVLFRNMVVFL